MSFYRDELRASGILAAAMVTRQPNGRVIRVAGCVITRQRPGTAKGFVFLSLEDETGIVNVIVHPDLFARQKEACIAASYVQIEGAVQNTWNVVSLKASDVQALDYGQTLVSSHDFH
jgi:error-prone DNA polymerase